MQIIQHLPTKKQVLSALFLMIFSTLAFAVQDGAYIGLLVGTADLDYSASNQNLAPAKKDEDSLAWRVLGGYKFNPNMALEAGYIDWPEIKLNNVLGSTGGNVKLRQKSADVMGKFIYPFSSAGSVYAEAGVTYVKLIKNGNTAAKTAGASTKDRHTAQPIFGIGASYEFYPKILADAAWIRIPSGSGIRTSNFFGAGITLLVGN